MFRRVLAVVSLVALSQAEQNTQVPSNRVLEFTSVLSGFFSNIEQVNSDLANGKVKVHDLINGTWKPVLIPTFGPAITLFHEEVINNTVNRLQIFLISEKDDVIIVQPLNISNIEHYKPGEYEKTTDFTNVQLQETEADPDCVIEFVQVVGSEFAGTIPDCKSGSPGNRAKYAIYLTCHSFTASLYWKASLERTNLIPYEIKKLYGYPLLPEMLEGADDFQPACDSTR